ncbi:hypothetical protein BC628DRAFT_725980 [Trametes gibbosa]|nr:hypothetical protein BC628DRAFT_725980 [Trametes gibbosa]
MLVNCRLVLLALLFAPVAVPESKPSRRTPAGIMHAALARTHSAPRACTRGRKRLSRLAESVESCRPGSTRRPPGAPSETRYDWPGSSRQPPRSLWFRLYARPQAAACPGPSPRGRVFEPFAFIAHATFWLRSRGRYPGALLSRASGLTMKVLAWASIAVDRGLAVIGGASHGLVGVYMY